MKTLKALLAIAFAITITSVANAQHYNSKQDGPFIRTTAVNVNGACTMCKQRIETAVRSLAGIWSADWNVGSGIVYVTYDRSKINPDKIERAIVAAGHDTDKYRTSDMVYAALPDCCHYSRKN